MRKLMIGLLVMTSAAAVAAERKETTLVPVTRSLVWESDGCAGESMAIVSGCPFQQGAPFVLRLRMAKGLVVPSHSHLDENITVLRGALTLRLFVNESTTTVIHLRQGDFFRIPAYTPHVAEATEETEIQTNGIGPLVTTWTAARCKPAPERTVKCVP